MLETGGGREGGREGRGEGDLYKDVVCLIIYILSKLICMYLLDCSVCGLNERTWLHCCSVN